MRLLKYKMLACTVLIAACGGGGGDAGDAIEFSVLPEEIKYTAGKGDLNCTGLAGATTVFTINGGEAPFRIVNSHPDIFSVDKTAVSGKDPQFKVVLNGGCGENLGVIVLDAFSNATTVSITIEKGEEEN